MAPAGCNSITDLTTTTCMATGGGTLDTGKIPRRLKYTVVGTKYARPLDYKIVVI